MINASSCSSVSLGQQASVKRISSSDWNRVTRIESQSDEYTTSLMRMSHSVGPIRRQAGGESFEKLSELSGAGSDRLWQTLTDSGRE